MWKPCFFAALLTILLAPAVSAGDGQLGTTHPVLEPDLLEEIRANLKRKEASGELARLKKEAIQRSARHIVEPPPVAGLRRTRTARKFYWDPTFIAPKDVRDPAGKIIVQKGTRLNPLDHVSWPQNFLFFDGRDRDQVSYARALFEQYQGRVKPILVGGNVLEMSRTLNTRMYFDQGGFLVGRFGIRQVPAIVSQEGKKLRIDEMLAPESKED
jgi:conjugal transfer pilus assembly protein TraW